MLAAGSEAEPDAAVAGPAAALPPVPRRHDRARLREDRVRSARLGARAVRRRVRAAERDRHHRPPAAVAGGGPRRAGARSLVIGVANSGGFIAETWIPALVEALEAGLDIVSGMHARLADMPVLRDAADRSAAG